LLIAHKSAGVPGEHTIKCFFAGKIIKFRVYYFSVSKTDETFSSHTLDAHSACSAPYTNELHNIVETGIGNDALKTVGAIFFENSIHECP
jgi:hypothetical protein